MLMGVDNIRVREANSTLRKAHPCGSYEWEVVRVGADIGLKCHRRVLLERGGVQEKGEGICLQK